MSVPLRLLILFVPALCLAMPMAVPAQNVRDKVKPAAEAQDAARVIDLSGAVYGLAFGASEDEVIQHFGKPDGYFRMDEHRTGLLYGKSHLLLCYDGQFDGVRISSSILDWSISAWIKEAPPFTDREWRLSNGLGPYSTRKDALALVKTVDGPQKYQIDFATEQCAVQLTFSHNTSKGEGDEAYTIYAVLVARQRDGKDHWSKPSPLLSPFPSSTPGKRVMGLLLGESDKGVRVRAVYKDSPADKAGLQPGDLISGINGKATVGMSALEVSQEVSQRSTNELEITSGDGSKRVVPVSTAAAGSLSNQLASPLLLITEVKEGDPAPDFEAKTPEGHSVKLGELKGAPVLINFTAIGCLPCREQTALLAAVHAKYKDRGLKMISVYLNGAGQDVFAYAHDLGADWPIYTDEDRRNAVARLYGVSGEPVNVLVGKDGKILATNLNSKEIDAALEKAVQ